MTGFEAIGQARISAAEGQALLARIIAERVARTFRRMFGR